MSYEKDLRKGAWSPEEDNCLRAHVTVLGERRWDAIAKATGLKRSGKSCRLRWLNYLRPNLNHSRLSDEEEQLIARLHTKWGNKWARIARRLPGRTDNEIKNYWRAYTRKKTSQLVVDHTKDLNDRSNKSNDVTHDDCYQNSSNLSNGDDEIKKELVSSEVDDVVLMSPYEDHFSNWITLSSITAENNGLGSSEVYTQWCCQEVNTSAVEWLNGTLWDLDSWTCSEFSSGL